MRHVFASGSATGLPEQPTAVVTWASETLLLDISDIVGSGFSESLRESVQGFQD